jgi:hypothetical protein
VEKKENKEIPTKMEWNGRKVRVMVVVLVRYSYVV